MDMKSSKNLISAALFFAVLITLILSGGPNQAKAETTFTNGDISVTLPSGWTAEKAGTHISMASPKKDFVLSLFISNAQGKTSDEIFEEGFKYYSKLFKKVKKTVRGPNCVLEIEDEPDKYGDNLMRMTISPVYSGSFIGMMAGNFAKPGDYSAYKTEVHNIVGSLKSANPMEQSTINSFLKSGIPY